MEVEAVSAFEIALDNYLTYESIATSFRGSGFDGRPLFKQA
jgi:hypothetical protein